MRGWERLRRRALITITTLENVAGLNVLGWLNPHGILMTSILKLSYQVFSHLSELGTPGEFLTEPSCIGDKLPISSSTVGLRVPGTGFARLRLARICAPDAQIRLSQISNSRIALRGVDECVSPVKAQNRSRRTPRGPLWSIRVERE